MAPPPGHGGDGGAPPSLRAWLAEGPYTLALSSSFFGFYGHLGALIALEQARLKPVKVMGSSAGAMIAGMYCSGLDAPTELKEWVMQLTPEALLHPPFRRCGWGIARANLEHMREQARARRLPENLEDGICDVRLSVFRVHDRTTHAISSGDGCAAIAASCAVPVLFQPVEVSFEDGNALCVDGGCCDPYGIIGRDGPHERVLGIAHGKSPFAGWRFQEPWPNDPNAASVCLHNLPKVRPDARMAELGAKAIERAQAAMEAALDLPVATDGRSRHIAADGDSAARV